ncbi:MAG TPA: glycosyltransferase family 2 protein [Chitinivibrionales bacterium]|nr:glycosyltransferase family 2 protein [Chitinivibrionales bacterium]
MTQQNTPWPSGVFVLIPAYKAAAALDRLLPSLLATVPAANVCLADDGSHDGTDMVAAKHEVLYVSNLVNRGKGAALLKGFRHLLSLKNASWIITVDADGQHSVNDLPLFLKRISDAPRSGIIIGRRSMMPGKMPVARIISNTLTSLFLSLLTRRRILDSQCGFRAYSAACLAAVPCRYQRFEMESEIIMRACGAGFSIEFVPVQTLYFSSRSHISHVADTLRWLRAVITVSAELRSKSQNECTR